VIAEGVETAEQVKMLEALGCDFVQGFYFARPASAAQVEPLVSSPGAIVAADRAESLPHLVVGGHLPSGRRAVSLPERKRILQSAAAE
jgi:hypothetical protein